MKGFSQFCLLGFNAFVLFYANSQYGFVSSSSISNESSLRLNPEITLDMTPPGFTGISRYGLRATTFYNSSDYDYHEDTKRDMVFDVKRSAGSGSSSNGEKEMDLVEMVLYSQFYQGVSIKTTPLRAWTRHTIYERLECEANEDSENLQKKVLLNLYNQSVKVLSPP
ncbi:hypothetical protein L1887_34258 [Cichorium endivia]|nr:hypothetical protein L1887_34258 [Cichorium endivia]